jgi:hypothetical protein
MKYGQLPTVIKHFEVSGKEHFSYQYLPIKLNTGHNIVVEPRLYNPFGNIIGTACCDFIGTYGLDRYVNSYVYITAKRRLHSLHCPITRPGWHSDGFGTDDINYLWTDCHPTIFNNSNFDISADDKQSLIDMKYQAVAENNISYDNGTLLRLDQFVVHKPNDAPYTGIRTVVKISISKDKYDLEGNSINYLLNPNWEMRPRQNFRNIPQVLK